MRMIKKMTRMALAATVCVVGVAVAMRPWTAETVAAAGDVNPTSPGNFSSSAFQGGVVVFVGKVPGHSLDQLLARDDVLVQCLVGDKDQLEGVRRRIKSAGAYGEVSADLWEKGTGLPFIDNFVNRLVLCHA